MNDTNVRCFPRMGVTRGATLWDELRAQPLSELSKSADGVSVENAEFYAMASERATDDDLMTLRRAVIAIATQFGFPRQVRKQQQTAFDRAVAAALHENMRILPADAACNDVWVFINLRLLPDVVVWRYGSWNGNEHSWHVAYDRIFKISRTTFGRLWWRVELLGVEGAQGLLEDEAVQLVERPRISGYRPLAIEIAHRHITSTESSQRMELLRDVMKRLTRQLAVVSVFAMHQGQIKELVNDVFVASTEAMSKATQT